MHPRPPQPGLRPTFATEQIYYVNLPANPHQAWLSGLRIDGPLIDWLAYLCRQTARKSTRAALYCFPSQAWLGQKLGLTRETVNRHVRALAELGLIEKTRRRKKAGNWQTCLYRVAKWVLERIRHPSRAFPSPPPPCDAKRTHSGPLKEVAAASPVPTTPTPSWAAAWAVRMAALARR